METWEKYGAVPNAIRCRGDEKFEITRRVAADNLAKEPYYLLADLGCIPESKTVSKIQARVALLEDDIGLIGLAERNQSGEFNDVPCGVRVCRKNFIQKWMSKVTANYDEEHAACARMEGKVALWPDIFYRRIQ